MSTFVCFYLCLLAFAYALLCRAPLCVPLILCHLPRSYPHLNLQGLSVDVRSYQLQALAAHNILALALGASRDCVGLSGPNCAMSRYAMRFKLHTPKSLAMRKSCFASDAKPEPKHQIRLFFGDLLFLARNLLSAT